MTTRQTKNTKATKYEYAWAIVFGLAALGINQWIVRLLAADSPAFFFGGALVLIAFVKLGTGPGIVASLISFISFFARGDVVGYVTALYVLEAFVAYQLNRRYHSLILSVMLFWFGGGWIADIILYHWVVGLRGEYVVLVFVKQIFNGIIIAMLAEVFLRLPILRYRLPTKRKLPVTTLHTYVFNRTVFVAMLPVVVFGLPLTRTVYHEQTEQAVNRSRQIASITANDIVALLESQQAALVSIGQRIPVQRMLANRPEANALLREYQVDRPEWLWIGLLDREGGLLALTDTVADSHAETYLSELANGTDFLRAATQFATEFGPLIDTTETIPSASPSEPVFRMMEPLHDSEGRFNGLLVAAVRTSILNTLLLRARGAHTETPTLVDQDNRVLASLYEEVSTGDSLNSFAPLDSLLGWQVRSLTYRPPLNESLETRLALNIRYSSYQQIGTLEWALLIDLPAWSLHADLMPIVYTVLGFLVATLLILHFVVTNMSGKVSDPLLTIDHAATEITSGRQADTEALSQLSTSSIAEVRSMATHVSTMQEALLEKDALSQARELESEERFRATFDQAAVGIAHTDIETKFLRVNKKFCEIVGYEHHEALQFSSLDLTHPDYIDAERKNVEEVLDGERQTYSIEQRLIRKDGGSIWVQATVSLVQDKSGTPKYFIRVVEDISPRKKLEEQLLQAQKMESIGQLAGGVAHDFNNLLTPIIGYAELAIGDLHPDSTIYANQKRVLESAQRARDLTQQLLAFGRKQVLHVSVLNLSDEVSRFAGIMRRVIRENINVHLQLDAKLGSIKADPSQLQQILMNLLVNAQDAMPEGGELTIETSNVTLPDISHGDMLADLKGECIELRITDTGHGMEPDIASHIFEPFFTTKERGKGTGLGPATVYGIVKQHGGEIAVETASGKGTKFRVLFPRVQEDPIEELTPHSDVGIFKGYETVLVTEDDETVRRLVSDTLQDHGYVVLHASRPSEAIARAEKYQSTIHLLLTDVVLPEMNGKQLYERLLVHRPELRVLYMSGYQEQIVDDVAVLRKPFTIGRLTKTLREKLDN